MNYEIITDSTCDLDYETLKKLGIKVLSFGYTIGDELYKNDIKEPSMSPKDFYDVLRKGSSAKTTQINISEFINDVTPILEEKKDILYICFSSQLSGTYNSMLLAKRDLEDKYPERRIEIVDSRAASMGEGLLVYYACKKKDEGLDLDDLVKWIEENKLNFWHWFTVDDINHLKRGGRLSGSAAFVAKALKIKPVLYVDGLGRLIPRGKSIGRKNSLLRLVEHMSENYVQNETVFISHGDCVEDALFVKQQIEKNLNVKEIIINYIGPVIGAHSGQGTVAVFYIGNDKRGVQD